MGIFSDSYSQTIWAGGSLTFTETIAGQTDFITAQTAFTRVNVLYNPMCQTNPGGPGCSYAGPCNTQWAVGTINNWNTLTYTNFYVANGCNPPGGLPKTYVVHLLAENIYMQVTFLSWQAGGPGMSYTRTTCAMSITPTATPSSLCAGQPSTLSVTATGQVGAVSYTWNPGGLTGSNVIVTPSTTTVYTVTGTDAGGCTTTATKSVVVSPTIIPSCSGTNNVCFGGTAGTASVTATGGLLNLVPAFTYNFNGSTQGWTTGIVGNLCFGSASLASSWSNQAFGFTGQSYGNTTVGGQHTYIMSPVISLPSTFAITAKSWSNNEPGYAYPGCTGYDVEYVEYSTDGGATWTPFFTTTQADLHGNAMQVWSSLNYTANITPTANGRIRFRYDNADGCCGGSGINNGWYLDDVQILVPGPYSYLWSNGATTATITGLSAGNYCVTLTDNLGCTASCCYTVTSPASQLVTTCSGTNVSCFGGNNGSASVVASGGTTGLTTLFNYNFNGSLQGWTTGNLTNMCFGASGPSTWASQAFGFSGQSFGTTAVGGQHSFIVSPQISLPANFTITAKSYTNNESGFSYPACGGYDVEYIEYSTDNGATWLPFFTTNQANLHGNNMAVWNTLSYSATITPTTTGRIRFRYDTADGCCGGSGTNNGWYLDDVQISAPVTYSYLWSNGSTNASVTGVPAGNYCVTVTDGIGCSLSCCYNVTQPAALSASATATNSSCPFCADGSVSISSVTGGVPPYSYSPGNPLTNLLQGIYCITVTDANGCTTSACATVNAAGCSMTATTTLNNNALCNGQSSGSATASPGGTTIGPFTYMWDNGNTSATANNLSAGNHSVTVTDQGSGCFAQGFITISQPSAVTASCSGTTTCAGSPGGSASVSAGGGTPPYTYLWSNGGTSSTTTGLFSGSYCVTVSDANGCTGTCCYTVNTLPVMTVSGTTTNVVCAENPTGIIDLTVSGGTAFPPVPPLTFNFNGSTQGWTTGTAGLNCNFSTPGASNWALQGYGFSGQSYGMMGPNAQVENSYIQSPIISLPSALTITAKSWSNNEGGYPCFYDVEHIEYSTDGGTTWTPFFVTQQPGLHDNGNATWMSLSYSATITPTANGRIRFRLDSGDGCCGPTTNNPGWYIDDVVISQPTSGGYLYQWSNGATTQDLSGVPAGTYTVTVTDALGCTTTYSATLTCTDNIPPSFGDATLISADFESNSLPPGWSSTGLWHVTSACITGTPPNPTKWAYYGQDGTCTYNTGLSNSGDLITNTVAIPGSATGAVLRFRYVYAGEGGAPPSGYDNASLLVSQNGGPYNQLLSLSSGTQNAWLTANLNLNSYIGSNVKFKWNYSTIDGIGNDFLGMQIDSVRLEVTSPPICSDITATNIPGVCGAYVSWTPPNPTDNCAYTLSSNHNPGDFFPVGSTQVVYTATDGCGNSANCSFNVIVVQSGPPVLTFSETHVNADCQGAPTGSIDLSVSGGTTPYTYLWSNGATTQDISNLFVGVYTVTVTESGGCIGTFSVSIGDFPPLAVSETHIDNLCFGELNGSIDVTATDGKPGYDFLWSDGDTNEDRTGLAAGTYTVTVNDNCGSVQVVSITITQPTQLATPATVTDVTCFGAGNGTISVNATGGVSPYSYQWSNGATTSLIANLTPGLYTLTLTDANGCTWNDSYSISQPPQFIITETHTDVSCFHGGNGTIDINPSGGTPPYSYLWSNGATSEDLINLTASTYFLTVTEANGCTTPFSVTITQPTQVSATAVITNQNCTTNGSIDLTTSGGTPPYAWSWTNGATTEDISNLTPGNYKVTILDANGCERSFTYTIVLNNTLLALTVINHNSTCLMNDGVATVTPTGGVGPYTYLWNTVPAQTTATATGLPPGTSKVIITDQGGAGCIASINVIVPNSNGMGVSLSSPTYIGGKNVRCNGGSDGSATATPLYTTGPYTYIWSTGATTATITGLSAGIYTVTVFNIGCIATGQITLTQPVALAATTTRTNASCTGGSNGTATANPTGGTPGYSYSWNTAPAQTTKTATGLGAGTYIVTVSDANGCTTTASATVASGSTILITGVVTNLNCNNINTGAITQTISGGSPAYTYLWNNGNTNKNRSGLAAGTYTVTVTDSKGCTETASYTITQPPLLVITVVKTNVSCNGGNNGTATASGSGGTPPYTYSWNTVPVQTNATATGLSTGSKTVVVTDSKGCSKSLTISISQPPAITISTSQVNVSTPGGNNGSATATAGGGVSPYSYSWNTVPVKTTQTITGLTAGTYTVTVTDANSCTKTKSVTITQPSPRILGGGNDEITEVTIYPNPSNGIFNLSFEANDNYQYVATLLDLTGRVVYRKSYETSTGQNMQSFDFSTLPKGVYVMNLDFNSQHRIIRLILE